MGWHWFTEKDFDNRESALKHYKKVGERQRPTPAEQEARFFLIITPMWTTIGKRICSSYTCKKYARYWLCHNKFCILFKYRSLPAWLWNDRWQLE